MRDNIHMTMLLRLILYICCWMPIINVAYAFHIQSPLPLVSFRQQQQQQQGLCSTRTTSKFTDVRSKSPSPSSSKPESPLSLTLEQLSSRIKGKGRAQLSWDCLRLGIDPLLFYNPNYPEEELDNAFHNIDTETKDEDEDEDKDEQLQSQRQGRGREDIQKYFPTKRRSQSMGNKALKKLSQIYPSPLGIESSIATLSSVTTSSDGTTKFLLKLSNNVGISDSDGSSDGSGASNSNSNTSSEYFIETVIIPHPDWKKSTLCISSQVGCAQGCVFCATGKMGKLDSLSADQILIQLYYANKICRLDEKDILPPIDNIVFMGMGDAADNIEAVSKAVGVMTDRSCFGLAPSKITISTVGPNPEAFGDLAKADAVLAWSVHAARDDLRKRLVPTTKHTMEELRDGLVGALVGRSKRLRNVMLEVTLMDGINDGIREAEEMAVFALNIIDRVEGVKLMINLIPFNDIGYEQYRRAKVENIKKFQEVLVSNGVKTFVRTTRGDDESAACGQLATKKTKKKKQELKDEVVAP
eukprot:CAMPEP_0194110656 /NCGR_PEP_ID=MMETSP0150-20130528/9851_1 /TAXON_ID=122233 /ORGANISM="Chaetoceros debilis, Strain MM31A-1" /LENGTH=525 /DNA_ID=CAMNT_0038799891 /DNA_START=14 /DNA_END=1591 /DNA_ORIENTATION=+